MEVKTLIDLLKNYPSNTIIKWIEIKTKSRQGCIVQEVSIMHCNPNTGIWFVDEFDFVEKGLMPKILKWEGEDET